jgi:tRNA-splicing ligase RtcB (3'-phosphate/5'-hydroxy nucleic acid ligase)
MPDGHRGYGFPIGGVAAFDYETGIISPGGIGFDINCGMRLLTSNLTFKDVEPKVQLLLEELNRTVPKGVAKQSQIILEKGQFKQILTEGVKWAEKEGYATKEDLLNIEDNGCLDNVDLSTVSKRAIERGKVQLGTLGSGNHYLELQKVDSVYSDDASTFGITGKDQICFMIHTGSRGFGHQVATDYLQEFRKLNLKTSDPELAYAFFHSSEGQRYYSAMSAAANMAYVNRQLITYQVRKVFKKIFGEDLKLTYDVAHNIAKIEEHHGKKMIVHRKGATRAYGPDKELPLRYQKSGQPVIIGGSMETGSWLLAGTEGAKETFNSVAHGAGRLMSRIEAKEKFTNVKESLKKKGIHVLGSARGLAEEAGGAYKDVDEVVKVLTETNLTRKIAKLVPLGNIKG